MPTTKAYRITDSGTDEAVLETFDVLSYTPKGYWVVNEGNTSRDPYWKRFVLADARKKFAHLTLKDAFESYIARKQKQIKILEARVKAAQRRLRWAERTRHEAQWQAPVWDCPKCHATNAGFRTRCRNFYCDYRFGFTLLEERQP